MGLEDIAEPKGARANCNQQTATATATATGNKLRNNHQWGLSYIYDRRIVRDAPTRRLR